MISSFIKLHFQIISLFLHISNVILSRLIISFIHKFISFILEIIIITRNLQIIIINMVIIILYFCYPKILIIIHTFVYLFILVCVTRDYGFCIFVFCRIYIMQIYLIFDPFYLSQFPFLLS